MAFDLKRFLKGVVAQFNPWDDGATYKSVTAPKPASTARPTANQTSINKTYQAKLPEAIRREESQVDWLGKLLTDRDWKKRAERNAMSQAINQEMNKTQDYQAPVIRNNLNALRGQNLTAFRNSQKAIDNSNLIRDYGQEWKKTAGSFVKDYANPLGKYGIFGEKSIAENTKNIQDAGDMYRSGVDKVLQDEANNKFDSWKDVARLALNLPVGMVQAVGEAPKDYRELFTGKRLNLDEKGRYIEGGNTDLTTAQRAGAGVNAFINTAGLALGGSGTLLKGLFGKQLATQATKQLGKNGVKSVLKKLFFDAFEEGGEEFVQSFAEDLQNNGGFDKDSISKALQSFGMGAAGGFMMTGGGKVISNVKTGINNKVTTGLVSNKTEVKPVVDPIVKQDTVKPITKQSSFNPSIEELNYTRAQRLAEVNKLLESGASENSRPVIDRLKAIRDIDETIKRETQQAKEADKRKKQSGSVPAGMFDPFNITDKLTKQEVPAIQPLAKDEVILYHRTSKENADNILKEGKLLSKENTGEVFLSNKKAGQNVGYGDTVIPIRVKKSSLRLDDQFPSGEKHYAVKSNEATPYITPTKVTQLPPERVKAILKKEKQGGFITNPFYGGDKTKIRVGVDKSQIFEGVDGKPRVEFDDSKAKIKDLTSVKPSNNEYTTLQDVLDHKELFNQYPGLKDIPVHIKKERGSVASIQSTKILGKDRYAITIRPDADKNSLMHEIQHYIQQEEGFAGGGSSSNFKTKYIPNKLKADDFKRFSIKNQIRIKLKDSGTPVPHNVKNGDWNIASLENPLVRIEAERVAPDLLAEYDKLNTGLSKYKTATAQYERLAGEAESRAVESRINMTPAERAKLPFYNSLDVPKNELLIKDSNGKTISIAKKDMPIVGKNLSKPVPAITPEVGKTSSLKIETATPEQKVEFANYVLGSIKKHSVLNNNSTILTNLRNKDWPYHNQMMKKWKEWSRYNVDKPNTTSTPQVTKTPENEMMIDVAKRLNLPSLDVIKKVAAEKVKNGGTYDVAARRVGLEKEWDRAVKDVNHAKLMDDQKNNPGIGILGNGDKSTPQPKPEVPALTPTKPVTPELPIIGQRLQNQTKAKTQSKQSQAKSPKVPANQGKQLSKQDTVLPVEVKSQIDSLVASSKLSPNSLNDALNTPLSQILGDIKAEADPALPTFNAVAAGSKSKSTKKLTNFINQDAKITKAAIEAQNTGKEINFFAKKDANDRGVGIERFNPKTHKIEAGFVVDQDGNILGNHIKVDDTGIQVNVGGDLVNMEQVIGNPNDWKGKYRLTDTPSRVIDSNAPNKQIAQTAKDYLVGSKVKAEANFRTELETQYKDLGKRIKKVESARPKNISKDVFKDDIFSVLNGDKTDANIRSTYDAKTAKVILDYKKQTRALYDSLLVRINKERVKFGQAPIDARKDYITHLQEMNGSKSFVGEVIEGARNSFTDEGTQTTRGSVPGQIAGRTENFKPISAYNKFLQRRKGTKSLRDPFLAVQEYLEPALYNIHMTEPTARARAVEAAFRTAGELRDMTPDQMLKQTEKILEPYKNSGDNSKLVAGFQEYANTLAKKTNRIDRVVIDSSQAGATGMKAWTGLQRGGGQATILGNVSSVLAQPLNQVVGIADAGPINYMKGVARSLGDDNAINQSNFIKARRAKANKPIRNTGKKILDAGAIPLEVVETASIEVIWNSQHAKAQSKGYKGAEAIKQADYNTERLVAGRGIGDRPEAYRSRLSNGLLQYTLEVNAQNKVFWKDLNTKQKATFLVAAMGTNALMGVITGFEPLPDFLKAAIDTGSDLLDDEDDRGVGEKLLEGGQRILGEYASMNPVISASANAFMPQDMRKAIFGSESDLGRFEGTAAPVQVIKNVYKAGNNAIKGNWTEARNDILRTIPFGNQARKSITGAEANARGYAVDRSGKPTYQTSPDIISQVKNFLFGPTADPKAREYYDNNRKPLTDLQAETLKTLEKNEQLDFLKSITEERAENKQNDKEIERLNKGSESETKTLKSGKVAYKNADGEWKIAKDQKSADIALKKSQAKKLLDEFEDSDKNYEVKDGLVYRRKEDGTAYTTPQNKFESQVRKQQLQSLKATDDVAGWLITAEAEAKDLIRQLNDPNVDPLDRFTIENDIRSLIENIAKYKNYGGFTKPKKAKKAKEPKEYKGTPRTPIASRTFSELYGDSYDTSSALRKLLQNASTIKRKVIK